TLTSAVLSNNGFTIMRFALASSNLTDNTHLKRLDISWIQGKADIDNAAVIENLIPFINHNTRLTELDLNHIGRLTDLGIEKLLQINERKRALTISLKGQTLSGEQISRLMEIKKVKICL
ncbi:MAG: hypothetical protein ACK4HV_00045, partial [Parachlamydiaceae bacterium]